MEIYDNTKSIRTLQSKVVALTDEFGNKSEKPGSLIAARKALEIDVAVIEKQIRNIRYSIKFVHYLVVLALGILFIELSDYESEQ